MTFKEGNLIAGAAIIALAATFSNAVANEENALIANTITINAPERNISNEIFGLIDAIQRNDVKYVKQTVDRNLADPHVGFALIHAVSHKRMRIVEILIDKGVDAGFFDNAAISAAVSGNQFFIAQMLLNAGADPTARSYESFHIAARQGSLPILKLLLKSAGTPPANINKHLISEALESKNIDIASTLFKIEFPEYTIE